MAQSPSEGDIDMLLMLSEYQVDRNQAIQILKISGNDVQTATNKMFDALPQPNGIAELLKQGDTSWDGTAFGNAGYGQHYEGSNLNSNVPSFRIDHDVDYANSRGPSAAPTRPPSRASQRPGSALSTHMGDVPMQSSFHSEDGSWQNIEPLTGFSGVETGQESGVVGSTGTAGVLRPATQNYYDSASWALVPATKSTEYIPDASLDAQIRRDKPGLIKPSVGDHHLPALITILHSIPLVRNMLLAPEITASNYWRGEDWWRGAASAASITVNDDTGSEAALELEFLYEVQRLIAFLDASDRTYASLESLLQLDAWTQARFSSPEEPDDPTDVLKFLLRWCWMYKKHAPQAQLDGIIRSVVNVNGKRQESSVLDVELDTVDTGLADPTLYDYIDKALFGDVDSAHILEMSNVLVLNLKSNGSKRNCKVPHILYADRYLEENRAAAEANFARKNKYNQQLVELDTEVERLKWHTPQKVQYPHKMETLKLLKNSMRAFESDTEAMTENPKDVAVLKQLQSLYDSVERKLSALEDEKKKAKEALQEISEHFRAPMERPSSDGEISEDSSQHKFTHPYKLCGVARSKTDYYISHLVKDQGQVEKDETWWHVEYSYKNSPDQASIDRNETTIEWVLKDVSEFSENAILVYANYAAFSPALIPLSAKLDTFVKKDNMNFQQEVADTQARLNEGSEVVGDWFDGDNGWGTTSNTNAENHYQQGGFNSSKTLTPDTDIEPPPYQDEVQEEVIEIHLPDEKPNPMEMKEVNGGISVWAGGSNASSETVGREDMQIEDVEMSEPRAEHIEVVEEEKKGG